MANASVRVCVTGASGYIATHIVKQLLEGGYTVRGTVRDPTDEKKTAVLHAIAQEANAVDRLELVKADLLDEGSFDDAVKDCKYVLHTASPFQLQARGDPEQYFLRPAVQGTENVLNAVAKAGCAERVIVTSSVAAIFGFADDKDTPFTEEDWNRSSTLTNGGAYSLSKRAAEEKAWEMAGKQDKYKLITINPAFVVGPTLTGRNDSASTELIKKIADGGFRTGAAELYFGMIDVRDVARAHIEAMTNPNAQGRYICSANTMSMMEIADTIRAKYPRYPVPTMQVPKFFLYLLGPLQGVTWSFVTHNVGIRPEFDHSKIERELGFVFTDPRQSVIEMVDSLVECGLMRDRRGAA